MSSTGIAFNSRRSVPPLAFHSITHSAAWCVCAVRTAISTNFPAPAWRPWQLVVGEACSRWGAHAPFGGHRNGQPVPPLRQISSGSGERGRCDCRQAAKRSLNPTSSSSSGRFFLGMPQITPSRSVCHARLPETHGVYVKQPCHLLAVALPQPRRTLGSFGTVEHRDKTSKSPTSPSHR